MHTATISQRFFFDAAHTLRREIERDSSLRVHGHTYQAEIAVAGQPKPDTGMVMDLGAIRQVISQIRSQLDHHMLDEVPELGIPTLENLCAYIAREAAKHGITASRVKVWREGMGDACEIQLGV
jgi:6-pyruvoyltetrahydropterin/6-carboxytetrahydropterin synthase